MSQKSIFEDFTNLYQLSKTLRFELKPVGKTPKMLEDNGVFEKDEIVAKNYQEAKKWFDKLHQEFIHDTLSKADLPVRLLEEFETAYFEYKNNRNSSNKKNFDEIAKQLRKEITLKFEKNAEIWRDVYIEKVADEKFKKKIAKLKKLDMLFKVEVFGLLKQKYPEAVMDEKSIFDSFNKFSTYFTGFHQTRQNFYKEDGTSTAVPTRIVNENLPKFLENKKIFEDKYFGKTDDMFSVEEVSAFPLEYFNHCLTQEQIDHYNDIVAGLKTKINLKRQKADKKTDFPFFKILFKQILGESESKETEPEGFIEITNDEEVFGVLRKFIDENEEYLPKAKQLFERFIEEQMNGGGDFEMDKIYVAGRFITQISNKYFADWNTIRGLFSEGKKSKKIPEFVSLAVLKEKIQGVELEKADFFRENYADIYNNEQNKFLIFLKIWKREFEKSLDDYEKALEAAEKMLETGAGYDNKEGSNHKENIRLYAESALAMYQMMKYFSLERGKERNWNPDGLDEDNGFYNVFNEYYVQVHTWQYFNVFRDYLTKKPYSEDKIKLNFENGTLLDGWDKNKERDNYGIILRKGCRFYLGIMHKNHNNIFEIKKNGRKISPAAGEDFYQKMVYKFLPDPKKMLPKVCFSKKGLECFKPSSELVSIKEQEKFKKNTQNFSLESLHKIIDYYKKCLKEYDDWKVFDFVNLKATDEYLDNIGDFYKDIEKNAYKVWFENVSEKYIWENVDAGKLYLFEIHNKDFADKADGKKNLHTLYWEEIFAAENMENPLFKLNGQAEVFFRKASLKKEVKEKKKSHDIIKNRRYTENKIFFHCPLKLNYIKDELKKDKAVYKGKADAFSIKVREMLAGNPEVNIIGIDRGEKHLAYYSVVDQAGNILDIGSFNKINKIINNKITETDYHKKLDELEKKRADARETWQQIGKIKDMKKGYVSQVVKKICDLMLKYNAIVVFEDLNVGFKRGRFAIEKQIYQNLELALAKKLNFLVFKEKQRGEKGHFAEAFQLTPEIKNFKDIYKQCGFMFYIPASYTSAICPVCGFRKNIPTPVETKEKNKEYLKKFDIVYEKEHERFCFAYERSSVTGEKMAKNKKNSGMELRDKFVFYSNVPRLQFKRNKDNRGGNVENRDPYKDLLRLFDQNNINIEGDINEQLQAGNFDDNNLYRPLIFNIRLILQLRNAVTKKDQEGNILEAESHDYISCPACYFHSEENLLGLDKKYKGEGVFEFNGDANGAYNIARKGGLILNNITDYKNAYEDLSRMENQDLTVTQDDWDNFVQKNS
jgi:hypothetical protein